MPFQKAALVLCVLGVLTLIGCATAPPSDMKQAAMLAPAPHDPPTDVVIYVEFAPDGKSAVVTPDTAYLDSPAQKIHWYANVPDFEVVFEAPASPAKPLPQVVYEKGKGRGHLENVPAKLHTAKHYYKVRPTGAATAVDPIIIVTY